MLKEETNRIFYMGSVLSVAFSPNGKNIATGCSDNSIKLWNVVTGDCEKILRQEFDISSLEFSSDGKSIVSRSSGHTVVRWDVSNGKILNIYEENSELDTSKALSPDGKYIAFSGYDKAIKLCDVATGECVKSFERQHGSYIYTIKFSADGKYIASGSEDKTVKIWDVQTGVCIKTFEGHTGAVTSVAFSPDGKTIVSGSTVGTVRLWDFPSVETILQRMRERYKGCELSKEERIQLGLE